MTDTELLEKMVARRRSRPESAGWFSLLCSGTEDGLEDVARTVGVACTPVVEAPVVPEPEAPLESGTFHAVPTPDEKIRAA